MKRQVSVFWFRRDLRLNDNCGFSKALQGQHNVLPLFIFDKDILTECPENDSRVTFLHQTVAQLKTELIALGSDLLVRHGQPLAVLKNLQDEYDLQHIISNRDYEPYAQDRDAQIQVFCQEQQIGFHQFKDQVICETNQIVKGDGSPYVVYTPYSKKWMALVDSLEGLPEYDHKPYQDNLCATVPEPLLSLDAMGFVTGDHKVLPCDLTHEMIQNYSAKRNFPAQSKGTSKLSPHLRFGTISIRHAVRSAKKHQDITFLKELIWREFFMQILWHFPHTTTQSFKPAYDRIEWRNDQNEFDLWCQGKTGYPLVDAGMRELNQTGYMHNRVRMVVASFLCKHLLIDWRWGESYFAKTLLDFELSSNVGNWQWAAGSGVDAAPYFRIFNPTTQIDKFDAQHQYLDRWVPERHSVDYPAPIVDHKIARERCLLTYKKALDRL